MPKGSPGASGIHVPVGSRALAPRNTGGHGSAGPPAPRLIESLTPGPFGISTSGPLGRWVPASRRRPVALILALGPLDRKPLGSQGPLVPKVPWFLRPLGPKGPLGPKSLGPKAIES